MTRNKSMFTASFDMGLSQTLSGRGYEALTRFTHWLAEIQRLAEQGADCRGARSDPRHGL